MYVTFDNPIYLYLLLAIPLFIISHFWFLKNSKSKAMKFANFETLKRISGEKIITSNMTHLVLRLLIIFALIISAAGTTLWIKGLSNDVNFVMAIDSSASMTSEDVKPTRFDASKEYMKLFVDNLGSRTKLGLISFAGVTEVKTTLSDSKENFKLSLEQLSISRTGGTDIPGAIITGTNLLLSEPGKGKTIIIISDGVNTIGAFISDSIKEAVKYAKNNQVVIDTIGVGTQTGPIGYLPEYYNVSSSFDEGVLKYISEETGGIYIYATNADDLVQAYDVMGENTQEIFLETDLSFLALLLSLILLFVEWGLANTIYRRVV